MDTMGTDVDGPRGEEGLWMTLSELAAARDVSKQAISKNITRWRENGHAVATRKRGKELLVNVADYDVARGEIGDLARQAAQETRRGTIDEGAATYTSEQRRKMGYEADLKRIELQRALRELVPAADVQAAAEDMAETVVQLLEQIVTRADEMTTIANKQGMAGVRVALKRIVRELRSNITSAAERAVEAALSAENERNQ